MTPAPAFNLGAWIETNCDQLKPPDDAFYDDQEARTCSNSGVVHPGWGDLPAGWATLQGRP